MLQDFYGVRDSLDFFEKDIFYKNKELQERLQLLKLLDIDEFEKTVIAFSDDQMAKFEYETNNNIKYNLKRLRNINNKNQQQVADKLGINLSTYSRYESGDVIIDNNRLGELAKWYMVPITDFYKEID